MSRTAADGAGRACTVPVVAQIKLLEEYSDTVFSCQGTLFKVHKAVVCSQSPVIQAAMRSGFQESGNNTLNMDTFTPALVKHFIQFLYSKDYDDVYIPDKDEPQADKKIADQVAEPNGESEFSEWLVSSARSPSLGGKSQQPEVHDPVYQTILVHTRMNAMADYYDVPELATIANMRISAILADASPHKPWIIGLPAIAEVALDIVHNHGLSDILATAIVEHIDTILAMGTLDTSPLMTPFGLELLKKCNAVNQVISKSPLTKSYRTSKHPGRKQVLDRCQICSGRFNCTIEAVIGELVVHCDHCGRY
ncbi:BTB/POZ fold domain containing protein [Cordyceps militaris CM01]|uniref:BTB/POZ fold domain containing protein n=1 Tax=Cordyceps militaris (strain CM01) TaxID=983644 RepID=G3JAI5_CORMM|nr:BTB/POZ fold domain containing protein [Cordyceps militaris CM01]EGX94301.1 BTB/POZ fold domain containing protein [Cordyceps militaris CM01]